MEKELFIIPFSINAFSLKLLPIFILILIFWFVSRTLRLKRREKVNKIYSEIKALLSAGDIESLEKGVNEFEKLIKTSLFKNAYPLKEKIKYKEELEKHRRELLIKKTKAPDYETALEIESLGFTDYKEYLEAKKLGVKEKKSYELLKKTGAPNLDIAKEVVEKGFPDYNTYIEAMNYEISDYEEWKLFSHRKKILEEIALKSEKIHIEELMKLLNFGDKSSFLEWIFNMPESIMVLDGDFVVFKSEEVTEEAILEEIDNLLQKYSEIEGSKKGKI